MGDIGIGRDDRTAQISPVARCPDLGQVGAHLAFFFTNLVAGAAGELSQNILYIFKRFTRFAISRFICNRGNVGGNFHRDLDTAGILQIGDDCRHFGL